MLKAVIFDLDDTLYPERDFVASGFRAVATWVAAEAGLSTADVEARLWSEHAHSAVGVMDRLAVAYPLANLTGQALVECYRGHRPTLQLEPAVIATLDVLRGSYQLGLISDGWLGVQENKVAALGVAKWMDCVCLTDLWGRAFWKPHERAFLHVLGVLGVAPAEACYVADNRAKDFLAPNRLGMHSVWLARAGLVYSDTPAAPGGESAVTIRSLTELPNILTAWH